MLLKIILRGDATDSPHKRSIWAEMPSEPVALLGLSLQISGITSLIDIGNWSIVAFVLDAKAGNTLSVITSEHCLQKNLVNKDAFSLQFNMNLFSTRRGGILGAFDLLMTLFKIFQYIFPLVCLLCNLFPKLVKYDFLASSTAF